MDDHLAKVLTKGRVGKGQYQRIKEFPLMHYTNPHIDNDADNDGSPKL